MRALLAKELLDLARNRVALVPVALVTAVSIVVPLIVIVTVPAMTGRSLAEGSGLADAARLLGIATTLSDEALTQLFLFQQFLLLFLVTPITGAMSRNRRGRSNRSLRRRSPPWSCSSRRSLARSSRRSRFRSAGWRSISPG
ncbi:MAG: hypothetical protein DMG00_16305 [Acidobacteria bacterium]|nr:MAG: hypothetical protein DMG00_16305 [Acidobacteriota bacterium]